MPETNHLNLEKLRSYVGDNSSDVKDMISLFLEIIPSQRKKMKNALKSNDWETLNYVAHQIKPSLDILGLSATKEKAKSVESLAKEKSDEDTIRRYVNELCQELDTICKSLRKEMNKI
jgi:HPt (histidine-containing phosphotransfer) domain-containing protein